MTTKYIDVDGYWGIVLCYDFDWEDHEEMAAIMESFGMRKYSIRRSLHILSTFNSGMAVSHHGLRMSVMFVGEATSPIQFWSTVNHELVHVEQAILDYYGEDWEGEPPAYLAGYLLQKTVEQIAEPCY